MILEEHLDHFDHGVLNTLRLLKLLGVLFLGGMIIFATSIPEYYLLPFGIFPGFFLYGFFRDLLNKLKVERMRREETARRGGDEVEGMPPDRDCFKRELQEKETQGLNKYLVAFGIETGEGIWIDDDEACCHGCIFAKTGVGKTQTLMSLLFQQMLRGRASGATFIDAKRDGDTLNQIVAMAMLTGRIEDLIVIDPLDPIHSYNFCLTDQKAEIKARKVLRSGLPKLHDQNEAKHYERLASDSIYRLVRSIEAVGLSWSIKDVAVALSSFSIAFPILKEMLKSRGEGSREALVELGHLAATYRNNKGAIDLQKLTDNFRGVASELYSLATGDLGRLFCSVSNDLNLTKAVLEGKIVYFMLPRLEEAEASARMAKVIREDLEVTIGEITSSQHRLDDPHLVFIDEGAAIFGPTWANLFELARKGRFGFFFGAQSVAALTDPNIGLSKEFFDRVMANVNLKIMMRVGDNFTAKIMSEWLGKVTVYRKSLGAGTTYSKSTGIFSAGLDPDNTHTHGTSNFFAFYEDEEDRVSADDFKHNLGSEKGLAWIDIGDGNPQKARCLWMDPDLNFPARDEILRYATHQSEKLGLSDVVEHELLKIQEPRSREDGQRLLGDGREQNVGQNDGRWRQQGLEYGDKKGSSESKSQAKQPLGIEYQDNELFKVDPAKTTPINTTILNVPTEESVQALLEAKAYNEPPKKNRPDEKKTDKAADLAKKKKLFLR